MQISQLLSAWGTYPALCCLSPASWWVFQHKALLGFFLQLWELFLGLIFLMLNGATAVRMSDPVLRVLHSMWATIWKRALKSGLTFPEITCELLAVLDLHSFTLGLQGSFSSEKNHENWYAPIEFQLQWTYSTFSIIICCIKTFATTSISPDCQAILSYIKRVFKTRNQTTCYCFEHRNSGLFRKANSAILRDIKNSKQVFPDTVPFLRWYFWLFLCVSLYDLLGGKGVLTLQWLAVLSL